MDRRTFLERAATIAGAATLSGAIRPDAVHAEPPRAATPPWYRRALRWGQTNIRESDVATYDIAWWRQHWKRTATQGVIVNAGGIVAYYPSRFPLHYRAEGLGDRDLVGELTRAAHEDGLIVLARMDSNRAHEDFYRAHPDWFAVDAEGRPYRDTELYVACVNSPYYEEYIPAVLREIVERARPEGFADNNWNGLRRDSICHCANCARTFRDATGLALPSARNWDEPAYRRWITWSYARRVEIWERFNRATQGAGGRDCLWIGMNSGSVSGQSSAFRDFRAICARSELVLLDHQFRTNASGFQSNGDAGKLVHGLLGWEKLIPESMAMYQAGASQFRLASKPPREARMWMLDGFAGGIQPWWHHVGATHEDRRMFRTAEPVMRWHASHDQYLVDRTPVATVGVVWSQTNGDFYGRDAAEELVELPRRGWMNALVRARIPYLPVHADDVDRDAARFAVLILPDLAAMTAPQVDAVRRFVARGGHLIATGETSRCDEWGDARPDFALADLLGAHARGELAVRRQASRTQHTYLRLTPSTSPRAYGPNARADAPRVERHPALRGFDDTDILLFGGELAPLRVDAGASVLATWIPPSPTFPPEEAWMRTPSTDVPALIVNERVGRGRVAFLPADLDRRYARDNQPDHGDLLANLVRWAAGGSDAIPLHVEGPGFVDCHLYRQDGRLVLHVVNLTSAATWRAPMEEPIAVGPLRVRVRLASGVRGEAARLLVAGGAAPVTVRDGWAQFELARVLDHEVVVIG